MESRAGFEPGKNLGLDIISTNKGISMTKNICHGFINRPRSIYQYSNMTLRLSGQTAIFGVVFFVSKSLLGIKRQKKLENLQF